MRSFARGMVRIRLLVFGLVLATTPAALMFAAGAAGQQPKRDRDERIQMDVIFSPGGGCQQRISDEIAKARDSLRVQAYYFTSKPIADAIVAAAKRGVDVCVVLDQSQEKQTYGSWRVLRREGVPVYFDAKHATANNKVILIDDRTIITGSFNFTKAAEEKNAENVLIIKNARELFARYAENFQKHLEHSKKYGG